MLSPPFVLLDDARSGGKARLYRNPVRVLEARDPAAVRDLLDAIRGSGLHAAGFLAYAAAAAFEPTRPPPPEGALLAWFGLFERWEPVDAAALLPDAAGAHVGPARPLIHRAEYDRRFAEVQALIAAGDIYQANLTFPATVAITGDPLAAYAGLRARAAAGWGAVVATGAATILSLSPEMFFALDAGVLTARPMKGTARRAEEPAADRAAAAALAADAKQRAENLMIVDLLRNDLSRVAEPGSVATPALFEVETYPSLHQLTSTVAARLAPGKDAVDMLAAAFPCGSITGAPKLRAVEALAAIEGAPRGVYTGAIGRIDADGDAQFNVAIRTLAIAEGTAMIGLGGGIVADSNADAEWDEAIAKGAFLTQGQRGVDLVETMAFDPIAGLALLERHLARMKASAEMLGLPFDRHATRNELQAATFRLRTAHRVRLLLGPTGRIAIEVGPPRPTPGAAVPVAIRPLPLSPGDYRLRHKVALRDFWAAARDPNAFETVFTDREGRLTEGSFTNVFVERDGRLLTPPLALGLLPGVLRAELIDTGRAVEAELTPADLRDGFLIGNAARGLIRAFVAVAKEPSAPL